MEGHGNGYCLDDLYWDMSVGLIVTLEEVLMVSKVLRAIVSSRG